MAHLASSDRKALMQNVARGVGLGGLATLILASAMAALAVAEPKIMLHLS